MKKTTLGIGVLLLCALFTQNIAAQKSPRIHTSSKIDLESVPKKNAAGPGTLPFERWMSKQMNALKQQNIINRAVNNTITIPVVIHVIHDGDAVGSGENLSTEQIMSQLTVLNQDFRRAAETNGWNNNPVGADTEIEFCLAQQDPNGLATTGIVRYNMGDGNGFEVSELDSNVKPNTIWDPNRYLNIWVVKDIYRQISNFLVLQASYTTYPTASGLEGIDVNVDADKDGIVVASKYFGSAQIFPDGDYADGRNLGRTVTHEVGHYLGLMNIWGDGDCSMDDYCADTPEAADGNIGCPTEPIDSCPDNPGLDMYQNFMDTTNDECQNIFTRDQKARMHTVLQNSPRRATLGTSNVCQPGITYNNDGAVKIDNVAVNICNNTYSISVSVINAGNNPMTSATMHYVVERHEGNAYTQVVSGDLPWTGSLNYKEEQLITLPHNSTTAPVGTYRATLTLTSVNGSSDETALNNTSVRSFSVVDPLLAVSETIYVAVKADQWGQEVSWKLYDSTRTNVLLESDPFTDGQLQVKSLNVNLNNCYIFEIKDSYGDGICCSEGNGFYAITKTNPGQPQSVGAITASSIIKSGGSYGSGENVTFKIVDQEYVGTKEFDRLSVKLYPNPAESSINLTIPGGMALPEGYTIYNSLGQTLEKGTIKSNDQSFNISGYANGVYFISLKNGTENATLRFVKY